MEIARCGSGFWREAPKVKALIEGVPYRGILTRMGGEQHILIILKNIREQIGKTFGDEIKIIVEEDTEPRVIEVPAELKKAFKTEKEAKAFFEKLAYTHQREYVMWINEAKREETRQTRVAKTIEMLKQGKRGK